MRGTRRRGAKRLAVALLLAYPLYLAVGWAAQDLFVFPGHYLFDQPPLPAASVAGLAWHALDGPTGRLEAWLMTGEGVSAAAPGPAVLFFHGNNETIAMWAAPLAGYRELGVSVLAPEYRGYGRQPGEPSAAAIVADMERWLTWLRARPEVDARRIAFHGRSLGGGIAGAVARRSPPAALVLQSTFTRLGDMLWRYGVPAFVAHHELDNLAAVAGLQAPVRIIHGRRDRLIPFEMAEALAAAGQRATLVAVDADHNDVPMDATFWREHEAWLRTAGLLPAARD